IFNGGSAGTIKKDVYLAELSAAGQSIIDGRSNRALIGGKDNKVLLDEVFGFTFPMRSRQDTDYTQELQNQQIADVDLVKDILSIDFTRPLYSPTRCQLLEQIP